jgi:hypothetical protein
MKGETMKATKGQAAAMIEKATKAQLAAAIKLAKAQPDKFSAEFVEVMELALAEK